MDGVERNLDRTATTIDAGEGETGVEGMDVINAGRGSTRRHTSQRPATSTPTRHR